MKQAALILGHIFLVILKITGIILLSLLVLLLSSVLLVLFVPVRYKLAGTKKGAEIGFNVRFSWLFKLVSGVFSISGKEKKLVVRLFGKTIIPAADKPEHEKKRKNRKNKKEKKIKKEKKYSNLETPETKAKTEPVKETSVNQQKTEPVKTEEIPETKLEHEPKAEPEKNEHEVKEKNDKSGKESYNKKVSSAVGLLKENKDFVFFVLKKFKLLFLHIIPKSLKGNVVYGSGDPCSTGQILGIIAMVYAKTGKLVDITPDFNEKILEFDVTAKGRICLGTLLYLVLRVYYHKDFRKIRAEAKKKEDK